MTAIEVGSRTVELSRAEKVFFPADGITKGDVVGYYHRIAPTLLPHVAGRPVSMERYPDGLAGEGFYQKEVPDYFPSWIHTARLARKEGGTITHALADDAATLVYLANQACLTPHVWLSRADRPDHPDRMIFDLDPPGGDFGAVKAAARRLRELLEALDLEPFVMTTGSRGLHVTVALDREAGFDTVRAVARAAAALLAERHPHELTVEQRKDKRGARIFLDTARNGYAQTAVPPYALRARPGAPVATPLDWNELDRGDLGPRSYTVSNIFRRLSQKEDPWRGIDRRTGSVAGLRERLREMRTDDGA